MNFRHILISLHKNYENLIFFQAISGLRLLIYNNEISLSSVIALAYYSACRDYTLVRELPTGNGFADMVFLPKRTSLNPALVVELKWDKTAEGAISQIKSKGYVSVLKEYKGNILLVGINYEKKSRKHQCRIEKFEM